MMEGSLRTDIRDNARLHQSFNRLTQEVFQFDFLSWYERGFWGEDYIPHALCQEERVTSNVSVNQMRMRMDGQPVTLIQLGTVMTDPLFRDQGRARFLMERVLSDHQDHCDGIYLFGSDSVLDFYPRFGFHPVWEYQYQKQVSFNGRMRAEAVSLLNKEEYNAFLEAAGWSANNSRFSMDNRGLTAFWTMDGKYPLYRLPDGMGYAAAEKREDTLYLWELFSPKVIDPLWAASCFGRVRRVVLGFSPLPGQWEGEPDRYRKEDCTLFVQGEFFSDFESRKLMFPVLSHA